MVAYIILAYFGRTYQFLEVLGNTGRKTPERGRRRQSTVSAAEQLLLLASSEAPAAHGMGAASLAESEEAANTGTAKPLFDLPGREPGLLEHFLQPQSPHSAVSVGDLGNCEWASEHAAGAVTSAPSFHVRSQPAADGAPGAAAPPLAPGAGQAVAAAAAAAAAGAAAAQGAGLAQPEAGAAAPVGNALPAAITAAAAEAAALAEAVALAEAAIGAAPPAVAETVRMLAQSLTAAVEAQGQRMAAVEAAT